MIDAFRFTLGVRDFDPDLLPDDSRDVNSQRFRDAVTANFTDQFAPIGGNTVVNISNGVIDVSWIPDSMSRHPLEYALSLLQAGEYQSAVPLLKTLLNVDPDDTEVLYNLGMAESDMGNMDRAEALLRRVLELELENVNALIALGVACQRNNNIEDAARVLGEAVRLDPENGYARRNLGGVLGKQGRLQDAEPHLRAAARLLPQDQASIYSLAHCLNGVGDDDRLTEADRLYRAVVQMDPHTEIAEAARRALTALAQRTLRQNTPADVRMDAVMYCLGALETFQPMDAQAVQAVAFEIAMLGRNGLDVNDPTAKYRLKTLPGQFSGLHLMAYMYVGFKRVAPEVDTSIELDAEYAAALELFKSKTARR